MLNTCKDMFFLMCEAAEEGIQKARIKAQQNRIKEIIRIDKNELESLYAKIGRIDVLGGDSKAREELVSCTKKIEARILRAEVRYEMLKNAASVDECTRAFEEKLLDTVESVRQNVGDKAKDIKEKIKDASEDLTIKAKDKAADLKIKAQDKLSKTAPEEVKEEINADEQVLENVDDILKRIEDTINSVDEESAEEFKF